MAIAQTAITDAYHEYKHVRVQVSCEKAGAVRQNRMVYALYKQASLESEGETPASIRRQCKLDFGVPILYAEDQKFHDHWQGSIKGQFDYEQMLTLMDWIPVTSLMNTHQKSRYIDAIADCYGLSLMQKAVR